MKNWAQIIVFILAIQAAFTNLVLATTFEGFTSLDKVSEFNLETQSRLQNGIFKVQIGDTKDMHGTAYLITSRGHLLTNVHNVKSCLDQHGLATSGYDGSNGELDCKNLTLKNSKDELLGSLKLVASYPYHAANGLRIEVAVVKSSSSQVLGQIPLEISEAAAPAPTLFAVGYAGKTSRSVRAIAKQIRNLNRIMQLSFVLEKEMSSADSHKLSTQEMMEVFFKFFRAAIPLAGGSDMITKTILPPDLYKWFAMKSEEVKTQVNDVNGKLRPAIYPYIKMLESLKFSQYRKGFIKSYRASR